MKQLDDYHMFNDLGLHAKVPEGFKKIKLHLIFDMKHDGMHKARLVADGHLTDIPVESVYLGVVSLQGIRLLLFIAELNKLNYGAKILEMHTMKPKHKKRCD